MRRCCGGTSRRELTELRRHVQTSNGRARQLHVTKHPCFAAGLKRLSAGTVIVAAKGFAKPFCRPPPTYVGAMPSPLKPREQGDLGELSAIEWLASKGARVALPMFHRPGLGSDRRGRGASPPDTGQDLRVHQHHGQLPGAPFDIGRKPKLDPRDQALRPLPLRLSLRACRGWPTLVYPSWRHRRQPLRGAGRVPVL